MLGTGSFLCYFAKTRSGKGFGGVYAALRWLCQVTALANHFWTAVLLQTHVPFAGYTTLFPERKAIKDEYAEPVICSLLCLDAFYFPALTSLHHPWHFCACL
jgi:hypothetical protein